MTTKTLLAVLLLALSGFVGSTWAQDEDPNLVAWWPLDGDAIDASGNGHDGSLNGVLTFEEGMFGQCIWLPRNGAYVGIDGYKGLLGSPALSISAWIKSENTTNAQTIVIWGGSGGGKRMELRLNKGYLRAEHGGGTLTSQTVVADGQWHHVAVTVQEGATLSYPEVVLYIDGQDDTQESTDPDGFNIEAMYDVTIGWDVRGGYRKFDGYIDELRLYDRDLTGAEIATLALRPKAWNPTPIDGADGVIDFELQWQPRQSAPFHDVYLGTSPDLTEAHLVAPQWELTTYTPPEGLEYGTTYYWRVDEIDPDGTVYPGDVWTFSVPPMLAWQPNPTDGAAYLDPNVTLTWSAGIDTVSHDVYFGADESAVTEGTGNTFQGNQAELRFAAGTLAPGTAYYWRIDEVDESGAKRTGALWRFTTMPEISIADPHLVAWWRLDAGLGARAVDWSGHGNHGDFAGEPTWVDGYDGCALEFDGVDDAVIRHMETESEWSEFTVSLWAKSAASEQQVNCGVFCGYLPNTNGFQIGLDKSVPPNYIATPRSTLLFGPVIEEWTHLAITGRGTQVTTYYNGYQSVTEDIEGTMFNSMFNAVVIGVNRSLGNFFAGTIDDVRVYDRALTGEELEKVMRVDPLRAYQPCPIDDGLADAGTVLSWAAGDEATQHNLYLGGDEAAVAAADTTDTSGIYRGRLSTTSYDPPEEFVGESSYFWRVDEINGDGTVTPGTVWTFTAVDYLILDDFERYTDTDGNRIFDTWLDGWRIDENGAQVGYAVAPFAERARVHTGRQSMPLFYDNTGAAVRSETERIWASPRDLTQRGGDTLRLCFQGQETSFAETSDGAITVSGSGDGVGEFAGDEFRFAYQQLSGDGSIIVRVDSLLNTDHSAQAGVMIREDFEAKSKFAAVLVTPTNGVTFMRRRSASGGSETTTEAGVFAPRWLKLTRTGNTLAAQHSSDGVTWTDVISDEGPSSQTVSMDGDLYLGLAVSSHNGGAVTTAEFSGVAFTGGVSGLWQITDVGVEQPGNSSSALYLTLTDSAESAATVVHPHASPVTLTDWQTWDIPLSDFSADGVNVGALKRICIGVGNQDGSGSGGSGRIYIDDILVVESEVVDPNNDQE